MGSLLIKLIKLAEETTQGQNTICGREKLFRGIILLRKTGTLTTHNTAPVDIRVLWPMRLDKC